jgi:hypothetical protein
VLERHCRDKQARLLAVRQQPGVLGESASNADRAINNVISLKSNPAVRYQEVVVWSLMVNDGLPFSKLKMLLFF